MRKTVTDGITPAGAGKTLSLPERLRRRQDHPRRCGENLLYLNYEDLQVGSPPQVRGKPAVTAATVVAVRITPAGAGKTD